MKVRAECSARCFVGVDVAPDMRQGETGRNKGQVDIALGFIIIEGDMALCVYVVEGRSGQTGRDMAQQADRTRHG